MKNLFAAIAATLLATTPLHAQSASVELNGSSNFESNTSYGVTLGLDTPVANGINLGVQGAVEDFMNDGDATTLYGGLRLGVAMTDATSLYGTAGYVNRDGADGYRLGTGLEYSFTPNTFTRVGYRYTDFGSNINSHAGTIGVGLRF